MSSGLPVAPREPALDTARFGAQRLYRDAGAMATSSVASAILGAAFWALAAILFPPRELGVMTAVMAVITSTGVVVASGIGDAFTALLPAVGSGRPGVYRRGLRVFWLIAVAAGAIAGVITILTLQQVRGSLTVAAMVAFGIVVWSLVNVQSSAAVALGRARWLPAANTVAGICKVALLPVLAAALHWHAVELAFIIATTGLVIVLGTAIARVMRSTDEQLPASLSEEAALGMFNGFFAQSMASSGLNFGVLTLSPFLVTSLAGPEQGALFALALSVVQLLDLMSMSMAVSLVVHASSTPEAAWSMTKGVLGRALALTCVGSVVLIAAAPAALKFIDPRYAALGATGVVATLSAVCVIRAVYTVWSGLQRARRSIKVPLQFNVVFAVALPLLLVAVCGEHGALGAALAVLFAQVLLSAAAGVHLLTNRREGIVAT